MALISFLRDYYERMWGMPGSQSLLMHTGHAPLLGRQCGRHDGADIIVLSG